MPALCCLVVFLGAVSIIQSKEVHDLPGLDSALSFSHYSGYLQASPTRFLHYWFVESQGDPSTDPIIFWFNGGPGCSSAYGLLEEMGPFLINSDGKTLRNNPHSWNKFANVVYLSSPAGVGFSYSTDGNVTNSDDQAAEEKYEALKQFFKQFPTFQNRATFLAGDSYGGVYGPILAARIIDGQDDFHINLQGLAIGNGIVDFALGNITTRLFAYTHGFVDREGWKQFLKECCEGDAEKCPGALTPECEKLYKKANGAHHLNPFDVFADCKLDKTAFEESQGVCSTQSCEEMALNGVDPETLDKVTISADGLRFNPPCMNTVAIESYLNDDDVRSALHIRKDAIKWGFCRFEHVSEADLRSVPVWKGYRIQYPNVASFVKKVVAANVRVLLYYGDTDMMCNFLLGQEFSARLGLPLLEAKKPWKVNGNIAGFKTTYEGLTFITVRGAGHGAAKDKPEETAYAIQRFLSNRSI